MDIRITTPTETREFTNVSRIEGETTEAAPEKGLPMQWVRVWIYGHGEGCIPDTFTSPLEIEVLGDCTCGRGEGKHHPDCLLWDSSVDNYFEDDTPAPRFLTDLASSQRG